jgi:Fe-S cluster assembly iron-binding protein IscA
MLTLTETATTVVKQIVAGTPDAENGGLRIGTGSAEERDFAVSVVAAPLPGDSVVESDGAKVYLEPHTSTILDDKTLDAQVGENGTVTFALVPQL